MIRGVSRYTVEVNRTGSPYFERAICFVRPEFARCDRVDLHRAARRMLRSLDASVEVSDDGAAPASGSGGAGHRLRRILGLLISAAIGAAGACILFILARRHIITLPFI